MDKETWHELIAYYKWVVSLATFILTVSIGFPAFGSGSKETEALWVLVLGWSSLSICIVANWLIIKSLVSASVIESVPEESQGTLHKIMTSSLANRLGLYGKIQNGTFLLGFLLVAIGFANNL